MGGKKERRGRGGILNATSKQCHLSRPKHDKDTTQAQRDTLPRSNLSSLSLPTIYGAYLSEALINGARSFRGR